MARLLGAVHWCKEPKIVNGLVSMMPFFDMEFARENADKLKEEGMKHVWIEEAYFPIDFDATTIGCWKSFGHWVVETEEWRNARFKIRRNGFSILGPATHFDLYLFGEKAATICRVEAHDSICSDYFVTTINGNKFVAGCPYGIIDSIFSERKSKINAIIGDVLHNFGVESFRINVSATSITITGIGKEIHHEILAKFPRAIQHALANHGNVEECLWDYRDGIELISVKFNSLMIGVVS